MQAADLVTCIRGSFADGIPNGWKLGWDESRFGSDIARLAGDCDCKNWTSFDYSRCNTCAIDCTVGTRELVLTVQISFVADVFVTFWTELDAGGRSGRVLSDVPEDQRSIQHRINSYFVSLGFNELPGELYNEKVEGISLELSEDDKVTVGKCLFEDHDAD